MGKAPAPTVDNRVLRSQTRRQATGSQPLQLVPLVPVNLQSGFLCFKCHLFKKKGGVGGTVLPIYYYYRTLCSCQPRHEQTKAPPPPASSSLLRPSQLTDRDKHRPHLPTRRPQFVSSKTPECHKASPPTEKTSYQTISSFNAQFPHNSLQHTVHCVLA